MESFHWDDVFVTGLNEVDRQHHILVDLVNELGDAISSDTADEAEVAAIIAQLFSYTQYHFTEEEQLMSTAGLDPRHRKSHIREHQEFLNEVSAIHAGAAADPNSAHTLLQFLTHWLAYHILGSDQNMSRQMNAIQQGATPEGAYEEEERRASQATEPLLHALNGLFRQMSRRNQDLLRLNQSLEEKVAKRTRALTEANAYLEEMALTDALTELPNRRYAMDILRERWNANAEDGPPLSAMMIDADHFKAINDNYGHAAGDRVLAALAAQLKQSLGSRGVVCRMGGDEFFAICDDLDLEAALRLAQEVVTSVSELHVPAGSGAWHGSVSVGVASQEPTMNDYNDLIKLADNAVYEAKRAGKNRVSSLQTQTPSVP